MNGAEDAHMEPADGPIDENGEVMPLESEVDEIPLEDSPEEEANEAPADPEPSSHEQSHAAAQSDAFVTARECSDPAPEE